MGCCGCLSDRWAPALARVSGMSISRQFTFAPADVFAALTDAVKACEKLRSADVMSREIAFGTRMSGWSAGSEWLLRVQAAGSGSVVVAEMYSAASAMAPLTDNKRVVALLDMTQELLAHHFGGVGGVVVPELSAGAVQLALEAGFPARHRRLLEPMLVALEAAERHAAAGEVVQEELALVAAQRAAASGGMFVQKPRVWLEEQIQLRLADGRLRRGAQFLGRVGANVVVMSDRVLQGELVHQVDGLVRASVEVGGQIVGSQRPTLTRMALGSVLPGPALLVGLAIPKDTSKDLRMATFNLAHPQWRLAEPIDPEGAQDVAGFAAQLNMIFADLAPGSAVPEDDAAAAPSGLAHGGGGSAGGVGSVADELLKLVGLRDAGVLTEEEFAAAKARLLA